MEGIALFKWAQDERQKLFEPSVFVHQPKQLLCDVIKDSKVVVLAWADANFTILVLLVGRKYVLKSTNLTLLWIISIVIRIRLYQGITEYFRQKHLHIFSY